MLHIYKKKSFFPECIKIVKVTPVYKKGPKFEYANYEPISLLSNLDKIIEKLMHKRLIAFLNDQKVYIKNNLDFKKKFLLCMQLLALLKILKRQ